MKKACVCTEDISYRPISHVLFDLDGLLIDTEDLALASHNNILKMYGKSITFEEKIQYMGLTNNETCKAMVDTYELPLGYKEYLSLIELEFSRVFPNANLMPGAERLIRHLHKNNIPFALATGSSLESVQLKIQKHQELFSLFHHQVLGSTDPEVKHGKPSPDIFLVCASRFPDKPEPEKCLVFEDAPNGVQAAVCVGMQCIMVPDRRTPRELTKKATLVINSLKEFKPELFGLPSFN